MDTSSVYSSSTLGGVAITENEGMLSKIARGALYAGVVLGLLGSAWVAWFPLASGKLAVAAVLLLVAAVCFVLSRGAGAIARSSGRWHVLAIIALPAVYLISAWYSINRSVAFVGTGTETDTVLFIVLAFVAFLLSFGMFRSARTAQTLFLAVLGAAALALVFQYLNVLVGLGGDIFSDKSANLIGKWNDFGLLVGFFALGLTIWLELGGGSKRSRVIAWVALALAGVMLALVHFTLVWWMLLAGTVFAAGLKYILALRARASGEAMPRSVPWPALIVAAVSIVFLIFGTSINGALSSRFQISSLEVRPAFSSTYDIGKTAHASFARSLIGSGPNTFDDEWLMYKPAEVNETNFWSIDFATGFSTISSAFVTVGVLGVIAWLIPALLALLALWRLVRLNLSSAERTLGAALGLGALYLWGGALFYAMSPNLTLLAFVMTGAFLGYVYSHADRQTGVTSAMRSARPLAIALAIVLIVAPLWAGAAAARRFISYVYSQQALVSLQSGNIAQAAELGAAAQSIEQNSDNLRLGIEISLAQMQQIAQSTTTPVEQAQAEFKAALDQALAQADAATKLYPRDYRSYIQLAAVYDLLTALNVEGARANEMAAYAKAQELNPKNPAIPLLMAQLEAGNPEGNVGTVVNLLTQSLQLKSNYTNALLFAVQLAVAQNDLGSAIQAQSAAVATAPDQAQLWFELGLLYYIGNDMKNSIPAIEKALSLVPEYANAQYFLGLAYYRDSRTSDSLKQFEALAKTNPDNPQVTQILKNLNSGKEPLDGIASTTPQTSTAR